MENKIIIRTLKTKKPINTKVHIYKKGSNGYIKILTLPNLNGVCKLRDALDTIISKNKDISKIMVGIVTNYEEETKILNDLDNEGKQILVEARNGYMYVK